MRLLKDVTLGKGFSIPLLAALICVDHFFFFRWEGTCLLLDHACLGRGRVGRDVLVCDGAQSSPLMLWKQSLTRLMLTLR